MPNDIGFIQWGVPHLLIKGTEHCLYISMESLIEAGFYHFMSILEGIWNPSFRATQIVHRTNDIVKLGAVHRI